MSYFSVVLADSPSLFWELQETSGTTAADSSGNSHPGTYVATVTLAAAGPPGVAPNAVTIDGSTGEIDSGSSFPDPLTTFSCDCWFKTATASGGSVVMHGDNTFQVYMQNNGRLVIGLWTGSAVVSATTGSAYNDGGWHHLAATYSVAAGMILYVDAASAASFASATPPSTGNSVWVLGNAGGLLGGAGATSFDFAGTVCAFAVYPATLTSTQVTAHYTAGAAAASVTYAPQRYGQAAPLSPAPWAQRDRRDANTVATAANPLVPPLDSAWQADARYSHLYGDAHLRDRRQYFTQRPLVSDPNLLASVNADPLALNPEQSPSSDMWRVAAVPAFYDRRLMPQQRAYYDTTLLATAELENELLGGAGTAARYNLPASHADRREVPQQRAYASDPLLLTTAELENELLGGADTGRHWLPAAFTDRRFVPQQRPYVSDPLLLTAAELENELLGGAGTATRYLLPAYADRREVPQQRAYVSDPLLLTTAELENELLGGAQTPRTYNTPATHYARWWMPQQPPRRADPLLIATALLENELLGGAQTLWHYITSAYIDRREVPQQRAYMSDPAFYPPPNPLDPLLIGQDYLDGHQYQAATHYDRREVPQQRVYVSDPSFYPTVAPTDPLTVAWGAGGPYWHLYHRAEGITDRREYPAQRAYVSDPLLLATALLENELLGTAETGKYYRTPATHAPRWWMPQQPLRLADPLLIATAELENELLGGGDTSRYYLTAAYWDRRLVPQERPYISDPNLLAAALLENELLGSGDTARHWLAAAYADRRKYPAQRLLVSDPNLLAPPVPLDPTQSAWLPLWLTCNNAAVNTGRREVPQQPRRISDPSSYPALPAFDPTTSAAEDAARRARIAATHADRREVPAQRAYSVLPQGVPPSAIAFTSGTPYSGWETGTPALASDWLAGSPFPGWDTGVPETSA